MIITHTTTPIARYNFPIQRQCNETREKANSLQKKDKTTKK